MNKRNNKVNGHVSQEEWNKKSTIAKSCDFSITWPPATPVGRRIVVVLILDGYFAVPADPAQSNTFWIGVLLLISLEQNNLFPVKRTSY
jgi:hypothetical protein